MDSSTSGKPQASIIVELEKSEYTVGVGTSVDIIVSLTNPGDTGDYIKVSLLGIPPGWITYTGPPAVWLPASGQEKVTFKVSPPGGTEGVTGSYFMRLQFLSQSAPERRKELELQLVVLPVEKSPGTVSVSTEGNEVRATPGTEIKIPVKIANRSPETDTFELSIQGLPASWQTTPATVISVAGWVEKKVELNQRIPASPSVQTGHLPVKISATSQKDPQNKAEAELTLILAAFESQGRVGVMMGSVQFSAAPGDSITVPISVVNRGLAADTFRLGVEGIPASWVSTAAPTVSMAAGERKDVGLSLRPSLTPSSQAGRNKFTVTVTSQSAPDQVVRVDCILTIAVFSQFTAELEPKVVNTGQPVRVTVKNQGNTQQVFQLVTTSQENQLVFDYLPPEGVRIPAPPPTAQPVTGGVQTGDPTVLSIPAGESASFKFTARPNQRQIIGGEVLYPFTAMVKTQQKQSPPMQGQVASKGMIPIWVIPLALFLCIVAFGLAIVFGRQSGNLAGSATQTYLASTSLGTSVSQTSAAETELAFLATQTFSAQIGQALSSTQTSAASTALSGGATQTFTSGTAQAFAATQTSAAGTLQAVAATQTISAYQTSVATQQPPSATPTLTPTQQPSPTATTPSTATATQVQIPRFGGVILFTSDRDGNLEIYNLDDAGHMSRLTNNPAVDMQAAWSPNMQKIAFTTNRDGNNEIYLMNADGSNPINLTNNPADDQYPTWSPDGQSIAFSTNRDGNYEIYVMNVATQQVTNLSNNPGNDTQPYWVKSTSFDPAGESIVFTSTRDGNAEIYHMKTDGSNQVNLTQNPANDSMAKGSPDGSLLAFTSDRDGNQEVYTMRIDGGNPANLTQNPSSDFGPCWAPNQAWVAFTTDRDGNQEVYILKPNTGEVYNLTRLASSDVISDWR